MGWTSGGVVSNVGDLKAFVQALASGSLVSSEKSREGAGDAVVNGAVMADATGSACRCSVRCAAASGAMPGYLSAVFTDPTSGLTIVVALNNSTPGPGFAQALAQRLASIASKVPAKQKGAKAVARLPWSEQQTVDGMRRALRARRRPPG